MHRWHPRPDMGGDTPQASVPVPVAEVKLVEAVGSYSQVNGATTSAVTEVRRSGKTFPHLLTSYKYYTGFTFLMACLSQTSW